MNVFVNDQPTELHAGFTLLDILRRSGLHEKKGIAVAVNDEVIRKEAWATCTLREADKIMIITATQGG